MQMRQMKADSSALKMYRSDLASNTGIAIDIRKKTDFTESFNIHPNLSKTNNTHRQTPDPSVLGIYSDDSETTTNIQAVKKQRETNKTFESRVYIIT
jgi:hypothetical protein